jgi:ubiquinone/menaquinone biosynthesis C-methylase UbiE
MSGVYKVKKFRNWQYDELKQVGVDYNNFRVAEYDQRHNKIRDIDKNNQEIIETLGLHKGNRVIEIGTGTGRFARMAAKLGLRVYAVDVSNAMLDYAKQKANEEGLSEISFHKGGFLTYHHSDNKVDAIISQLALHHLPDFWKQIGLLRLSKMLKKNGQLLLQDVIFSFDPNQYSLVFEQFREKHGEQVDEDMASEFDMHIREEISTWSWIMRGMLERAGVKIEQEIYRSEIFAHYLCRKV